jgi:hypothetical protein
MSILSDSLVFVWFSATSFVHGYALLAILCFLLRGALPASGLYLFLALLCCYIGRMFTDRAHVKGHRKWEAFTNGAVTRAGIEYFRTNTLGADELDIIKGERCLFGLHPHGIYPMAGILTYAGSSPLLAQHPWLRVRPCGASVLYSIPLIREYLLWTGHLDASRKTLSRHMANGKDDIGLVIGGEKEALLTQV